MRCYFHVLNSSDLVVPSLLSTPFKFHGDIYYNYDNRIRSRSHAIAPRQMPGPITESTESSHGHAIHHCELIRSVDTNRNPAKEDFCRLRMRLVDTVMHKETLDIRSVSQVLLLKWY